MVSTPSTPIATLDVSLPSAAGFLQDTWQQFCHALNGRNCPDCGYLFWFPYIWFPYIGQQ